MKKLGHIPDAAHVVAKDLAERPLRRLIGVNASASSGDIDFSSLLDDIPDQGATSSCVGNAFSTAIYLRAKVAGHPIARPSRKAIYDVARLVDDPHVKLDDLGCRPRAAILGMQKYGLVAEERWKLAENDINQPPPLDVFLHGIGSELADYARIASGAGAADAIDRALASGFPVPYAQEVDQSYFDYDGSGVWSGMLGPSQGGHMQCIGGRTVVDGTPCFIVIGSWGRSFGRGGRALIARSFFDSGQATDILVPKVVPQEVT